MSKTTTADRKRRENLLARLHRMSRDELNDLRRLTYDKYKKVLLGNSESHEDKMIIVQSLAKELVEIEMILAAKLSESRNDLKKLFDL